MAKNDDDAIKKPHQNEVYDENKIRELKKCLTDPMYFIENYVTVQHTTRGAVKLILYPYQKHIIENFIQYRYNCVMTARQMGKCVHGNTIITKDGNPIKIQSLIRLSLKDRLINKLEDWLINLFS